MRALVLASALTMALVAPAAAQDEQRAAEASQYALSSFADEAAVCSSLFLLVARCVEKTGGLGERSLIEEYEELANLAVGLSLDYGELAGLDPDEIAGWANDATRTIAQRIDNHCANFPTITEHMEMCMVVVLDSDNRMDYWIRRAMERFGLPQRN